MRECKTWHRVTFSPGRLKCRGLEVEERRVVLPPHSCLQRGGVGACDHAEAMAETRTVAPMTLEVLRSRREEILEVAARHGASNLRVFGSVVRGEADRSSDVDFLVDMDEGRSLLDMGGLLMDLREVLGCEVDVVTLDGLRSRIRPRVLASAKPL